MELSQKQRQFLDQMMAEAEAGKGFKDIITDIVLGIEDLPQLKAAQDAIKQLESETLPGMQRTFAEKLAFAQRQAFANDGRYRGVFANESQARAFGLWALGTIGKKQDCLDALKKEFGDIHKAMDTVNDPSIVMPEFSTRMQSLFEDYGVFERNAFAMPMSGDSLTFMRETGEVTVYCIGEGAAPTQSDIDTASITLNAKKWATLTYFSSELGEDAAVAVAELLARSIARAMARKMDDIGFNGDGTGAYFGISGIRSRLKGLSGTIANIAGLQVGSGNAYDELTLADHEAVAGRLPQYADNDMTKWYCSRTYFFTVMVKLMLAAGGVTAAEIEGKRRPVFMGYPVDLTQVMPSAAANSQVCAVLGDVSQSATVGNRRQLNIKQSDQYKFGEDQITTLATRRVAVNVHDVGNAAATASGRVAGPVVGLITAAS